MNAAEIMTRSVVTVPPAASVLDAIRLMLDQRISGLRVVNENGLLVGILTEGDLLRRAGLGTERHQPKWLALLKSAAHQAGEYVQVHGRRVESVMTRDVVGGTKTGTRSPPPRYRHGRSFTASSFPRSTGWQVAKRNLKPTGSSI